jgi:hypothetical protein
MPGAATEVDLHKGTQQAPIGRGAGVHVEAGASIGPKGSVRMSPRLGPFKNTIGPSADLEAGVGAGNVEEARAVNFTNPDIIDRRRFTRGKIGGLCPGNRNATGNRSEKAPNEVHYRPPNLDPSGLQATSVRFLLVRPRQMVPHLSEKA